MKRYTIDVGDRRFVVDVQDVAEGEYRVMVGDRWYTCRASQGREVGQDWDIVERETVAPVVPVINITMPEQPAPVVNVAAPVIHVPAQARQAPPQVTVNVPQQPAPVVRIEPAAVNVNIPDIKIATASVAHVKRDYTGKITDITSTSDTEAVNGG